MLPLKLEELIELFAKYTRGETHNEENAILLECIRPSKKRSKEASLNIYKRGYLVNLKSALESTYSATSWALEEDLFSALSEEYILENPSTTYNLNLYGENFPDFLFHHKVKESIPFISDLAQFEKLLEENLKKPQRTPVSAHYFSEGLDEDTVIHFKEDFFIFSSQFQITQIFFAKGTKIESLDFDWNLPEFCIGFRQQGKNRISVISEKDFLLLSLLLQETPLGKAFEEVENRLSPLRTEEVQEFFYHLQLWQCVTSPDSPGISGQTNKLK